MAKKAKNSVFRWFGSLLTREDWVYALSLLVPLFAYDVALKVARILGQLYVPGPLAFLDQVRSDVLFNLGYALLWIGFLAAVRGRVSRIVVVVLFHLSAVLVVALTTSAHFFYQATGSTLGWSFAINSLSSLGEIRKVIASEVEVLHYVLAGIALLYAIFGPAIVTRLITHRWCLPGGGSTGTAGTGERGASPVLAGLMAIVAISLSVLPSATGAGNAFSRDALVNMAVGGLAAPEVEARVAPGTLPTDTSLVTTRDGEKRNVVVVIMESTRARSTTPYNEAIKTTPFMDELAEESLLAERAHAVVPHTSKALVASLCGVPPPLDTAKTESEPDIIPARCVPDLLDERGYRSAYFQSATKTFERREQLVENIGYDDFYPLEKLDKEGFEKTNYFGYEDDIMLEPSRAWLEEHGERPFFTTYLTLTGHHNYVVPDSFEKRRFASEDPLNKYLNAVSYQDRFLEKLFDQYKAMGLYEDTIFVVFGDHGEGFDEHNLKQHDNVIYNEGLRIPLIIHDPRNPGKGRIAANVNELDILPTLADLLGFRVRGGDYPGTSVLSAPESRPLKASCYHERTCVASIEGNEKYIYFYGNKGEEFYDLSRDPYERTNIIELQDEAKIAGLRNDLLTWAARVEDSYDQKPEGADSD